MAPVSEHSINWKDWLGDVWARKVLSDAYFSWVHGKNLLELKRNGTRMCTRLTHFISFLKETSLQDAQTSLPAVQQANIHVQFYKFLTEGGQVLFCSIIFCILFLPILNRILWNSHNVPIYFILKPKTCPNWSPVMWYFDGQLSTLATKFHFEELKQKRVWMEVLN